MAIDDVRVKQEGHNIVDVNALFIRHSAALLRPSRIERALSLFCCSNRRGCRAGAAAEIKLL